MATTVSSDLNAAPSVAGPTPADSPSSSDSTSSTSQSKKDAFRSALLAALNATNTLKDGGGVSDDDDGVDDGSSLTIKQGSGFPIP